MAEDDKKLTLTEAKEELLSWREKWKKNRHKVDETIGNVVESAISVSVGALAGVADGYNGDSVMVAGIDGTAAGAFAAQVLAYTTDSKYAPQLRTVGNALGAVAGYKGGKKFGARMKSNKDAGKPIFQFNGESPAQIGASDAIDAYAGGSNIVRHAAE